jgi:ribonuclease VapC
MQVALGPSGVAAIERLLRVYAVGLEPVDGAQVEVARDGRLAYGKGGGEDPAVLKVGDLFAYALAKRLGLPLLFKGDDFARTSATATRAAARGRPSRGSSISRPQDKKVKKTRYTRKARASLPPEVRDLGPKAMRCERASV